MSESNDRIPVYLLWFLLRIRRHSGEKDYFVARYADMKADKVAIEAQMIRQLHRRGLILLPFDDTLKKSFGPSAAENGSVAPAAGEGEQLCVDYWASFGLTPAGKYALLQSAWDLAAGALGTFATAVLAALAALLIGR